MMPKVVVDVQVLTDKTQAAGKKEQIALAILEEDRIPVYAGRSIDNALMHCKFCVIEKWFKTMRKNVFSLLAKHPAGYEMM